MLSHLNLTTMNPLWSIFAFFFLDVNTGTKRYSSRFSFEATRISSNQILCEIAHSRTILPTWLYCYIISLYRIKPMESLFNWTILSEWTGYLGIWKAFVVTILYLKNTRLLERIYAHLNNVACSEKHCKKVNYRLTLQSLCYIYSRYLHAGTIWNKSSVSENLWKTQI